MVRYRTGDTSERSAARSFVKHLKHTTPCPRGRASPGQQRQRHKNRQGAAEFCGKNYSGKKGARGSELPDDLETWCLDMLERVENRLVRNQVERALRQMIGELLRLAEQEKESAVQRWAGELLANIYDGFGRYDRKLRKANAGYGDELDRLAGKSLTSALFPRHVGEMVERELRVAENYRRTIPILVEGLKEGWKQEVPEKYWLVTQLEEFSVKSSPQWWDFLWPSIKERIDVAFLELRYRMSRKRSVEDSKRAARDHLELLARLSDKNLWVLTPASPA